MMGCFRSRARGIAALRAGVILWMGLGPLCLSFAIAAPAAPSQKPTASRIKPSPAAAAALKYADALSSGDRAAAGRLDFACLYRLATGSAKPRPALPPDNDPVYADCAAPAEAIHGSLVVKNQVGLDLLWPTAGGPVFFPEALTSYPASAFVMDTLGLSPPGGGLKLDLVGTKPLPAGSLALPNGSVASAPATLVTVKVTYKDPLTAPVTYAAGTYKWTNTIKRARAALKSVDLQWVVLSGLKKAGFPADMAVVNLPVSEKVGAKIPFVTESSRVVEGSSVWFGPDDAPGVLLAAVGRAALFPEQRDRVALLNRVLIVDPGQPEALTLLTRDLYHTLLGSAATWHKVTIKDAVLLDRFNEFYWDIYAQTQRMEIALNMEIGGFSAPTSADFLYRLIPAMDQLTKVRPEDVENRARLGTAYRWNNDQLVAIATHEAVLKEIQPGRPAYARALLELAWSRIAKVSWNRRLDDPDIVLAFQHAEAALQAAERPVDKFAAAYTMGYSLAFRPNRDNQAMAAHLTEAQRWYKETPGATPEGWAYLVSNDTLKGVLEADPVFKPLRPNP